MDRITQELIKRAQDARSYAYAPFSKLRVGAAILTRQDKIFTGCNVENSSYGLTICAERVAIFQAITRGEKDFKMLVITSNLDDPIPPCGACLAVLKEFTDDLSIVSYSKRKIKKWQLATLLPEVFKFKGT